MIFEPPPPQPQPVLHPALALAGQLALILGSVTNLIFFNRHILGPLTRLVHNRIAGAARRVERLLANLAAGRLPRPRAPRPRPGHPGGKPAATLPRTRGLLGQRFGHHMRAHAGQLRAQLHSPQTLALIAAAPPQSRAALARALRAPCRLLGVDLPEPLRAPPAPPKPKPPRPPRAPRPKPVLPEHRPGWERPFNFCPNPPRREKPA